MSNEVGRTEISSLREWSLRTAGMGRKNRPASIEMMGICWTHGSNLRQWRTSGGGKRGKQRLGQGPLACSVLAVYSRRFEPNGKSCLPARMDA